MSEFMLERLVALEKRLEETESIDSVAVVVWAGDNSGQAINHNIFTPINFNSTIINTRSAVTTIPNWRFNAPVGGYYHISAAILIGVFNTNWAVGEAQHLWVYKNGAAYCVLDAFYNASSGGGTMLSGSTDIQLAKNDYIEIVGYQFSGVTLNLTGDANYNWVAIHKIAGVK